MKEEVFIAIQPAEGEGLMTVYQAHPYQAHAYHTFMKEYEYNVSNAEYVFKLVKFLPTGLIGDYSSFCVMINDKAENHILSNDEELLRGFVSWRNRLMGPV